ncbi:MAG: DUF2141 domain-containing protein [Burkholderiales bacterium]|nr:DUF2141 domain-containing protein [Burkholderiales bacterium]
MTLRDLTLSASSAAGLALALGLTAPATTLAQGRDDGSTSLRLEVSAFRNAKGTLNCRLFTEASSFPDGEGARTLRAAIAGTQASCVFDDLPRGTYAVAVVHDENGNGRLDKNFLGLPTEGYGVSNNRTYAASSPKWDESRFVIAAREPVVLRVNLRY